MIICLKCKEDTWKTTSGLCSECEAIYEQKFQTLCSEHGMKPSYAWNSEHAIAKYWFWLGVGVTFFPDTEHK